MNSRGLLKDDTTYVHCNTIADEEFKLMADSGGTASIAPELEMHMGHGHAAGPQAPRRRYQAEYLD